MEEKINYNLVMGMCVLGVLTQMAQTILSTILLVPLMDVYQLRYIHFGNIIVINFLMQTLSGAICIWQAPNLDKKKMIIVANLFSIAGLIIFAIAQSLFRDAFKGFLLGTAIFSIGSGILSVTLVPIMEAIIANNKEQMTTKMFTMPAITCLYAVCQAIIIMLITGAVVILGITRWRIAVLFLLILPILSTILLITLELPIIKDKELSLSFVDIWLEPFFWWIIAGTLLGGATFAILNQYVSIFFQDVFEWSFERANLIGMAGFVIMMGVGSIANLHLMKVFATSKLLLVNISIVLIAYNLMAIVPTYGAVVVAVYIAGLCISLVISGLFWLTEKYFESAGGWVFSVLIVFSNLGASIGIWCVGQLIENMTKVVSPSLAFKIGIFGASLAPMMAGLCFLIIRKIMADRVFLKETEEF